MIFQVHLRPKVETSEDRPQPQIYCLLSLQTFALVCVTRKSSCGSQTQAEFKQELQKVYQSICVPTLTSGRELWVETEGMRSFPPRAC